MVDSGQEQGQSKQELPQSRSRRTFLKGLGVGAAAGVTGGWGLRDLFSRGGKPAQEQALPPQPTTESTVKPDTSVNVQSRVWDRNRPDGTIAYAYPITPEERVDIERDAENVGKAIKEVLDADTLKASGVDVDQVILDMKGWDDKKISEWAHRSNTDRGRFEPDLEEVSLPLGETGIWAWYVDNTKTGELGALRVSVTVDGDGRFSKDDPNNKNKPLTTQEGLMALPSKLSPLVKAPSGASSAYSHDKLSFTSNVGSFKEGGPLEVADLKSATYPTSDGQSYQLFCSRRGSVYDVSVFKHKPDVDLTIRGKASPIQLP